MNLQDYILGIQLHLIKTHQKVLEMFDINPNTRNYRPKDQGWTISEILEHIALTSHFLLILIEKGTDKALKNVQNLSLTEEMEKEKFDLRKIDSIGIHKSFDWIRPEHMEPQGQKTDHEIKTELINQLHICLNQLQKLKGGEGLLYKTTMTVNGLGKLNVYEYILFLSKHAERHLYQIEENIKEYTEKNNL
ncbi:MAG: DinB family protein [Saprospiraceae bacterium]|nr:DinB family protein [Saprospiraceae bacterium]